MFIAGHLDYLLIEAVNLVLGEPVPLVSNLIGFHTGIFQQYVDINVAVPAFYELDIGIYYSAVIERQTHVWHALVPTSSMSTARGFWLEPKKESVNLK
jgi:hypothetical protein